jgi:hypothetical protein
LDEPLNPDDKKPEKQIKPENGLNRLVWDMHYQGVSRVPDYYLYEYKDGTMGPLVLPGKYEVRLTVNGKSQTASFEVKLDPRIKVADQDLQKQFDLLLQIRDELSRVYDTVNQIQDVQLQIDGLKKRLPESVSTKPVVGAAVDLDQKLLGVRDELIQAKVKSNEDSLAYPQRIDVKLAYLAMAVGQGTDSAPTEAEFKEFDQLKKQADESCSRWADIEREDLAAFDRLMAGQKIQVIVVPASDHSEAGGEAQH